MGWFFVFFFVSGFCSVLYEIIWLRLSMAQFGVTSALVSIVLSMFMAGLGLGSWVSGLLLRKFERRLPVQPLRLYALAEVLIGLSAIIVPFELQWGRSLLERLPLASSWSYYLASGTSIALTIIPWSACMGATIPIAMLAIRRRFSEQSHRSFSFLYLANVLGAVVGATLPLLLIEIYGFRGASRVGAVLNLVLAATAVALTLRARTPMADAGASRPSVPSRPAVVVNGWACIVLLFATGLTSMGLEVVWIRQFTPYLGTVVYAFGAVLAVYLLSTFVGSQIYRIWSRRDREEGALVWILLALCALLPLLTADPQFHGGRFLRLILGLGPFSCLLGFVTPMLVDRWSGGDPDRAGRAYAINVLGCILGPLMAGFVLLPLMGERWVLIAFALPWMAVGLRAVWTARVEASGQNQLRSRGIAATAVLVAVALVVGTQPFENRFTPRTVLRDNTATVIATGEGMERQLLINGTGITVLTPVTKMMAHLPLAFLDHAPKNALVVCFGMGTTFRSLLSWNIPATAVDLVPSVPRLFGYYHADAADLMKSPLATVVVDDGRRYLERTSQQYDVITIDPPPPVEAAGSSMLYSKEFYAVIKQRLRPDGILQQWLPYGDAVVRASVARALTESFPHVLILQSIEGWGFHFLASQGPLTTWTPAQLVDHMPARAVQDMMEWGPAATPEDQFARTLARRLTLDDMIADAPGVPALQDDRPENEYYAIRRFLLKPEQWHWLW